jgi:hypothetical protein
MNLLTNNTHALHISPTRISPSKSKHLSKEASYRLLSVNRELLDLAPQMQQPLADLNTFGLWKANIFGFFCFAILPVMSTDW